ncbi:MAG: SLBB domain-containing protein [Chitinophagaceae bacterium]
MKLTRFAVSLICLLCFNTLAHSQILNSENLANVKVESISDEEIKGYYQRASTSGLTEDQVYQILASKGMPQGEIDKLKRRLESVNLNSTTPELPSKETVVRSTARKANADAGAIPMEVFRKDSVIFGSELFSAASSVFEPNLRIATPSGYILGPDDEVVIHVFGFSEQTYNLTVNAEGNIYIPNVGPLYVNGLSIDEALAKVKAKLAGSIYKAISSGQTKISLDLGKIRSIRVTVIGEARRPGTYTVSSLTTLFNLLYLCGGPSDIGSYRNIELIRAGHVKRTVDIYDFLTKGDTKDNVLLEELDVVRIPYYQTRVTLSGRVKREGKYELKTDETLNKVLEYAGGFMDDAYKASVTVTQLTDREKKIVDIPTASFASYKPQSSDIITVGKILNRYANRVNISGAILRPGDYEIEDGMTLQSLISKAGGLREDAYLQRGVISRLNEDMSPASVSFDIREVIKGSEVIKLKKEDFVSIGSIGEMKDRYVVSIEGQVHKPGEIVWRENLSLKDVIFLAGGFSENANTVNIEVSRRIKDATVGEAQFKQAEVIIADLKTGLSGKDKDIILQPFDMISVRSLPGYVQQRSVFVNGEVMSAGKYTLTSNTEKITDLVKRFGGFTSGADSSSITLKRVIANGLSAQDKKELFQRLMSISDDSLNNNSALKTEINKNYDVISIDLQEAMKNPAGTANLVLEDGDYFSVSRYSSLVRIAGEVYYPTLIPHHNGSSMKYYLQQSGGYTENARKNSALVIYPDGQVKTISKFLFFKSYPSILPRSEIFVPTKNKNNRSRLSTGEWVAISSVFATLGTLLITAFKK